MSKLNFDIRDRIRSLRPRNPALEFQHFRLPGRSAINRANYQMSRAMTKRFHQQPLADQPTYGQSELMAKLGDIEQVSDPVEHLRDFHETHMSRIIDQFRASRDMVIAAEQLSNLRLSLVRWAFRLTALEQAGNLGLLMGGSAVNGVHTFLTDIDFVVLPHQPEDRESARRVQGLMSRLLLAAGLDADYVMPQNFEQRTFPQLADHYLELTQPNPSELLDDFKIKSAASFFRFLMDTRLVDAASSSGQAEVIEREMSDSLAELQQRLIYDLPDHVVQNCADSYRQMSGILAVAKTNYLYEIKHSPLRLFHYALYANRAKLGIRESNFWLVIDQLRDQGRLSIPEANQAMRALRFFIGLRHFLGLSLPDTMDSTKIREDSLRAVSTDLGVQPETLQTIIETKRDQLLEVAHNLLARAV